MKRAFTLVELLVVVGIVALLVGILVPALMKGRRAAEDAAGSANLRSLSQVMGMYTGSNDDGFLNPFGGSAVSYAHARTLSDRDLDWDFGAAPSESSTEAFAFYWYSYLADLDQESRLREEQFAPADAWMKVLKKKFKKKPESRSGLALWPSSFVYSPTFYSSPSRYQDAERAPATAALISTQFLQGVTYPSMKAMLFERADFGQQTRPKPPDQQQVSTGRPPAFNNIRAKIAVATVDGSVREVDMSDVYTTGAIRASGMIAVPDRPGLFAPHQHPELNHGADVGSDAEYPAYFWATREGIEGRDLPN